MASVNPAQPTPFPRLHGWLLLGACVLALAGGVRAAEAARPFSLGEGMAAQTLKQFALQAEREIVFSPEIVADVKTHAVAGELGPKAALDVMLADTGLVATEDRTGAFAVRRVEKARPERGTAKTRGSGEGGAEVVTLTPFTVAADSVGRYAATEATSGTRVRVALMDSPQSVSVITRDLIEDIGAMRILDAAKYVAGVSESTIPNAQDRTNLRGFQTDGATIDGFNFFSFSNVDPVLIDRIEVVKGPNAILSPQIVQGTINIVSRKPLFSDVGYVAGQVGRYNADRVEFDANRVIAPGRLAVRVIGAAQHAHDQAAGNFNHSQVALPMFTYRFSDRAALTVQGQFYNAYTAAYGGLPIDLYVGTHDPARLLSGLATDLDLYTTMAARHSTGQHYRLFFTAQPTERLSVRLAANTVQWSGWSVGLNVGNPIDPASGAQSLLVALDSATGEWRWTGRTNPNPVFPRAGTLGRQDRTYFNLQNDFVYEQPFAAGNALTLAGYMIDYLRNPGRSTTLALPDLNIRAFRPQPYTVGALTGDNVTYTSTRQVYLNEAVTLLGGKALLSAGVARAWYEAYVDDRLRQRTAKNSPAATLPSGGAVFRPAPSLAFFLGMSRQSTAVPPSTTTTMAQTMQTGAQYEIGTRAQFWERRVYATLAYFHITQNNFAVPNPANSAVPAPNPALPPTYTDLQIHGVELELRAALSSGLSLVGNAAWMDAHTPLGQPFRGVADRTAAAWLNYTLPKASSWHGLSVGVGVETMSRRAGDFPSSTPTSASTPQHLIMPQPSFWLPGRTLVNAAVTYRAGEHWKWQLNVDNALDRSYLAASTGRNTVFPGTPVNPRLSVTYKF